MGRSLRFIFVLMMSTSVCVAELYKWVDEDGHIQYSDVQPQGQKVETVNVKINSYESVSYDLSIFDLDPNTVVMYSTNWCGYCEKARNYFRKNNITYIEYDIEKDSRARRQYERMNGTGVPVILVGKERMNGFSVSGFRKIYKNN